MLKGFMLHKKLDLGPLRINLSKNGLGFSLKIPFGRMGKNSRGQYYIDINPPVNGIRYRKYWKKK